MVTLHNGPCLRPPLWFYPEICPVCKTCASFVWHQYAAETCMRLFNNSGIRLLIIDECSSELLKNTTLPVPLNESLKTQLHNEIMRINSKKVTNISDSAKTKENFIKDLKLLKLTGEKTPNISLLLGALESIPATSVEAERAFSTNE